MGTETQHHYLKMHSSLGEDALVLERLSVNEGMSRLFLVEVGFVANSRLPDLPGQIGETVAVSLSLGDSVPGEQRFFHGHILSIRELGKPLHNSEGQRYTATLVPRAWSATHRINCRIFQDKTAVQIVEAVLQEHQVKLVKNLSKSLYLFNYCVQYQESDWDFVSRLLAHEGLSFFFTHTLSGHEMVITDNVKAYRKAAESDVIFCSRPTGKPHISSWYTGFRATATSVVEQGFDFHKPAEPIDDSPTQKGPGAKFGKREVFDYLGEDRPLRDNAKLAGPHLQGLTQHAENYRGVSDYRSFGVGMTFSFTEHEDRVPDHNEFVVTEMTLEASAPLNSEGQSGHSGGIYANAFRCMPTKTVFRPARIPKPIMPGIQTATVTCAAGEEIHVDEHGRIKVLFHWDREGKADQKSSCWIRVAQSWAGAGFGAQFLPRQGQEVLVEFVNGDPDQPLVTGSVYNGRNKMPYPPLDERNSSGIRSRSTTGGAAGNYSELRFDDSRGKELLVVHAERDHELTVENDQADDVGNDRKTLVGNDDTLTVKNNQTVDITGDQQVRSGKTITVEAGTSITLKTGAASITMESSGAISMKGTTLSLQGTAISLKAAKISLN
ncbi:MAG: type VI secretion system tip protein VgrG [Alteromonadaceae bacterium]|nr:type VI secretion system tip protein VgrG [Alteromonadaceae bacterium]|tara:strand:- start:1557 stop:3380 length:1824 start_codon:yes stop_codon:yes gene_type:complete